MVEAAGGAATIVDSPQTVNVTATSQDGSVYTTNETLGAPPNVATYIPTSVASTPYATSFYSAYETPVSGTTETLYDLYGYTHSPSLTTLTAAMTTTFDYTYQTATAGNIETITLQIVTVLTSGFVQDATDAVVIGVTRADATPTGSLVSSNVPSPSGIVLVMSASSDASPNGELSGSESLQG